MTILSSASIQPLRRPVACVRALWVFCMLAGICLPLAAQSTPATRAESGTFRILLHGQTIGTESYALRTSGDGLSSQSRIRYQGASGSVEQSSTLRLGPDLSLIHYQWKQGSARVDVEAEQDHLSAQYRDAQGHEKDYAFYMPATTAILDDNFYFFWQLLADRYDRTRGGVQRFRVFVPHTGDPGTITMEARPSHTPGVYLLHAQTDEAAIEISMKGAQLERLELPSAGLTVVREASKQDASAGPGT